MKSIVMVLSVVIGANALAQDWDWEGLQRELDREENELAAARNERRSYLLRSQEVDALQEANRLKRQELRQQRSEYICTEWITERNQAGAIVTRCR